jgi:hypothetical protein
MYKENSEKSNYLFGIPSFYLFQSLRFWNAIHYSWFPYVTIIYIGPYVSSNLVRSRCWDGYLGCAQEDSWRLFTMTARVQFQVSSCGICGGNVEFSLMYHRGLVKWDMYDQSSNGLLIFLLRLLRVLGVAENEFMFPWMIQKPIRANFMTLQASWMERLNRG